MKKIKNMTLDELIRTGASINAEIALRSAVERKLILDALAKSVPTAKAGNRASKSGHALKGRKLPPLYRNPGNRSETWAGRGHKPRWLTAALKRGKRLEHFAIK
ncbi:H-NS family nucleoid-associated regulatory protein [Reyranella massiliensis]|uniref:H-NS histone family protein n=1 Tax=Reyranella massiliensis TaxID=445220 RepID=UPI00030ED7C6|nr:H-NS histone family protein [Reyranella massiliensis]